MPPWPALPESTTPWIRDVYVKHCDTMGDFTLFPGSDTSCAILEVIKCASVKFRLFYGLTHFQAVKIVRSNFEVFDFFFPLNKEFPPRQI